MESLSHAHGVRVLDLSKSKIGAMGATALGKAMASAGLQLHQLTLDDNDIGDVGVKFVVEVASAAC